MLRLFHSRDHHDRAGVVLTIDDGSGAARVDLSEGKVHADWARASAATGSAFGRIEKGRPEIDVCKLGAYELAFSSLTTEQRDRVRNARVVAWEKVLPLADQLYACGVVVDGALKAQPPPPQRSPLTPAADARARGAHPTTCKRSFVERCSGAFAVKVTPPDPSLRATSSRADRSARRAAETR